MSPKFLVGTVGADLLIKSDEACRDLVDEAKNYLLLPQERPLMQGPRTRSRKPIKCGEVLFAGWFGKDLLCVKLSKGGFNSKQNVKICASYTQITHKSETKTDV